MSLGEMGLAVGSAVAQDGKITSSAKNIIVFQLLNIEVICLHECCFMRINQYHTGKLERNKYPEGTSGSG